MTDEEWEYPKGFSIVRKDIFVMHPTHRNPRTVKQRFVDYDRGEGFYYLEWEENGENKRTITPASIVHSVYEAPDDD